MVKKKVVQETMDATTDDIQAMLDNAASLRELGMVEEAVVEYEKLFDTDCPPIKIIPGLVACLSKTKSPHSVVQRVENVINDQGFDDQKIARIRFYLGLETERGGYMDLALDLYKRAAETDPENSQVQERLEGIISRLSKGSKYDYLIHKNLVTQRELQTALGLSKKMRKSVEFILMQQFKVKNRISENPFPCSMGVRSSVSDPICPYLWNSSGISKRPFCSTISGFP